MNRHVHAPRPAGVSEVVPTVAPAPLWAGRTSGLAAGFTSLLTSFPQLNALESARSGRMNNLTRPIPLHSPTHTPRSRGHAVIRVTMAHSQTCRTDQRRHHRWAESRTSDDAASARKCARAYFLTGKDVGTRHQSARPLDPVSARAVTVEPDPRPIAIESADESGDLEDCVRRIVDKAPPLTEARWGRLATLLRLHAADRVARDSRCDGWHFELRRQPTTAIQAARTEEQHR
jgi:hypothetical protein